MAATAPGQRGSSGGPLLDRAGNLLGVVSVKVGRYASNGQATRRLRPSTSP